METKTVFITGTSSGIGKACVKLFATKGWNVMAAQRTIKNTSEFNGFKNIQFVQIDVTDNNSIQKAIDKCINTFGQIDVLINNAGKGMHGIFEGAEMRDIHEIYQVNVFGLMRVIKASLPNFRNNKSGLIINISSLGGRVGLPFRSIYNSSKFAVEGFSEVLMYELKPLNVRVKVIEPGFVNSRFHSSLFITRKDDVDVYKTQMDKLLGNAMHKKGGGASPDIIAKTVYKASTSDSNKLRYVAGKDARLLQVIRAVLPFGLFSRMFLKMNV